MDPNRQNLSDLDDDELTDLMDRVGAAACLILPASSRFLVIALDPYSEGEEQYIGNLARDDAVRALRRLADRIEAREVAERRPFCG